MKTLKVLLILVAVVCIGVAVSYPIRYKLELDSNNSELEDLSSMRRRVMEEQHVGLDAEPPEVPEATEPAEVTETPEATEIAEATEAPEVTEPAEVTEAPEATEPAEATEAPEVKEPAEGTEAPAPTEAAPDAETPSPTQAAAPEDTVLPEDTYKPADTIAPEDTYKPAEATAIPGIEAFLLEEGAIDTPSPRPTSTPTPTPSPSPSPTPDRSVRDDADTFKDKQKIRLDEDLILPELKEIYALNNDLVGWLYIEDTNIDYPVVQSDDGKFYLTHDFYGRSNANGQIILEDKCDPYTPSYNLVLSGHHMNSGAMFGRLGRYKDRDYWETHKIVEFDTLMARKRYVVFGAFYSADYDEHEEGFRYSADIQYKLDADMWLDEIRANQIYETGVDAEFGDEFITLTTCDHSRRYDGRFVVVARRIREGERIQ